MGLLRPSRLGSCSSVLLRQATSQSDYIAQIYVSQSGYLPKALPWAHRPRFQTAWPSGFQFSAVAIHQRATGILGDYLALNKKIVSSGFTEMVLMNSFTGAEDPYQKATFTVYTACIQEIEVLAEPLFDLDNYLARKLR